MEAIRAQYFAEHKPKAVVVISAHWESNPFKITSAAKPHMLFDYYGFPAESYTYSYPAPGDPALANKIHSLFESGGIKSELDNKRGFDHGVFIPLMILFPDADVPVVCVSLQSNLNVDEHVAIGKALQPLRDDGVLILGSGYTFHNLPAFFNPTASTKKASSMFNDWLKDTLLNSNNNNNNTHEELYNKLRDWDRAPGARISHPREEHLLPLFVVAASGGASELIFEDLSGHAVSGYLFQ
jgi:aromatic ring-opening dioxygenase catalytic subunit (LigB family)